ncbi:CUB domain-containing protein 2-like [Tubulanus polymorphus]|uniref:CUB domain-containing protein 2-like n=1 Tax=Tubulanus polymorphus TaxID=672921 RepID=UPI003DA382EF
MKQWWPLNSSCCRRRRLVSDDTRCIFTILVLFGLCLRDSVTGCGGNWTSTSQNLTFTSPNYPDVFPVNSQCIYKYRLPDQSPGGTLIAVVFDQFRINDDVTGMKKNTVSIADANGNLLGVFSANAPKGVTSLTNEITVTFQSVGNKPSSSQLGFKAQFQELNSSTADRVQFNRWMTSGSVSSPAYPLNYPNGFRKQYQIVTANKKGTIKFNFQDFDLGSGAILHIYEEGSKLLPLFTFTSAKPPKGSYYTSLNHFSLEFVTSSNQPTRRGFDLTFIEYCKFEADEIPCYLANDKDKLKHTIILGSALGVLAVLVLVIGLVCYGCKKVKKKRDTSVALRTQFQHERF